MVLGIQWLAELGPTLWDFNNLRMKFIVDGRKFVLRGETTGPKKLVSTYQIQKDSRRISQASAVQIFSIQGDEKIKLKRSNRAIVQLVSKRRNIGRCLQDSTKVSTILALRTMLLLMGRECYKLNKGSLGSLNSLVFIPYQFMKQKILRIILYFILFLFLISFYLVQGIKDFYDQLLFYLASISIQQSI